MKVILNFLRNRNQVVMNVPGHRIFVSEYLLGSRSPVEIAPGIFADIINEKMERRDDSDRIISVTFRINHQNVEVSSNDVPPSSREPRIERPGAHNPNRQFQAKRLRMPSRFKIGSEVYEISGTGFRIEDRDRTYLSYKIIHYDSRIPYVGNGLMD